LECKLNVNKTSENEFEEDSCCSSKLALASNFCNIYKIRQQWQYRKALSFLIFLGYIFVVGEGGVRGYAGDEMSNGRG